MAMTPQFSVTTSSSNFLDVVLCLLLSLVTGPSFMSISSLVHETWQFFFYKGLTGNLKIENNRVRVFLNILRLGQGMNAKFDTNVSNNMLLNTAKYQSCRFYRFWVIKGKPTVWVKLPPPRRLGLHFSILSLFLGSGLQAI